MATYHRGELAVQQRAGLATPAAHALRGIGSTVPAVAAAFLAEQPMIVVGAVDGAGRAWSSLLTGEPGFLRVPDPTTVLIDALPLPEDPLASVLGDGPAKVGMIAIEPATRRRMRVNGTATPRDGGLRVDTDQVISNCPKYIQQRSFAFEPAAESPTVRRGAELTVGQQLRLSTTDTFFVATASPDGDADASHRGGNPGFVRVLSPTRLRWPDYRGNTMFLTLGNLALRPTAGLVVPGWDTGSVLQLTGTARTDWNPDLAAEFPGAQRIVDFDVTEVRETLHAVPLRWTEPGYSRFNPPVSQAN
ncbi:pyridoxamine 5'-phosphate oxidase family protein [Solihabitans fulvus]|uniref:Pyridoxamine 5'-phosphate oxidase family protein n=1 Tax=Solihabitans fulvus TaxID=1892852 RepID=A0A5B2XFT2_9PSEU|nr:pyridoxamine 5'-phosphate oxidase family protein [Solihabitans fulvus]KAA2261929.1 pyridoxamine 5'-phosphate oxidase family protein [Solihabitans fulvus]